jgi:hypothetical protein
MRTAEWSSEAAVENQKDDFLALVITQLNLLALKILQGKIRGRGVYSYFCHHTSLGGYLIYMLFNAGSKSTCLLFPLDRVSDPRNCLLSLKIAAGILRVEGDRSWE